MSKIWKKGLALALTGTLVFSLAGCTSDETTSSGSVTETSAEAEAETDTAQETEAAEETAEEEESEETVAEGEVEDAVVVEEGDVPYIALGADLSSSELATVLSLMGITEEDLENYDVVYVTNEQEHEYLDSYISSSTIGTRALSSVLVMEAEEGAGITVDTYNISYCTSGMYENALATAGIEDAEVIVAGPFSISGTAALIGAIEAYSVMNGTEVSEDVIDGAVEEIVVTGELEESTGTTDEVEGMVAYLKEQIAENGSMTEEELTEAIEEAAEEFDVTLTDEDIESLLSLLQKLQSLDLDWDAIANQAQNLYNKLKEMGFDLSNIDTEELAEQAGNFISKIISFFQNLFSGN